MSLLIGVVMYLQKDASSGRFVRALTTCFGDSQCSSSEICSYDPVCANQEGSCNKYCYADPNYIEPTEASITTVDAAGYTGLYTSIAIDAEGNPVISYYYGTSRYLRVYKCGNPGCTSGSGQTVDSSADVGQFTSIAIGADKKPVISYFDTTYDNLKMFKCNDARCTSGTSRELDSLGSVGMYTSIAIPSDEKPVISYYDGTSAKADLKVYKCDDADCSSGSAETVDSVNLVGTFSSIAIGADDLPVISYYDQSGRNLKVYKCSVPDCSSGSAKTLDSTETVGQYTSIAIPPDGKPVISYYHAYDVASRYNLKVYKCSDANCSSGSAETVDSTGDVGQYTSIAIGTDGLPIISYYDSTNRDLKVAKCTNATCSTKTLTTVDSDPTSTVGQYTSIAIGTDDFPVISYWDIFRQNLKVAKCDSVTCAPCGNGRIDVGEECDDRNASSLDGCSNECKIETPYTCAGAPSSCSRCGDNIVGGTEECDDNNLVSGDGCSSACLDEVCGDNIIQEDLDETCDNGTVCQQDMNPSLRDVGIAGQLCKDDIECFSICVSVSGGKRCDGDLTSSGISCNTDADCVSIKYSCSYDAIKNLDCTSACTAAVANCGDGFIYTTTEDCDDDNQTGGDGCSAWCEVENGYVCAGEPSTCNTVCGDGIKVIGKEECDDDNTVNGDGCSAQCTVEECGDGVIQTGLGEVCDDRNLFNNDGCTASCKKENGYTCSGQPSSCNTVCGDGIRIIRTEECDDGNDIDTDSCTNSCNASYCGDNICEANVEFCSTCPGDCLACPDNFSEAASWSTFDASANNVLPADFYGFGGGVSDGDYIYFPPKTSNGGTEFLRYDTSKDYSAAASWTAFDLSQQISMISPFGYKDAIFDGRYVYFIPSALLSSVTLLTNTEVVRYDTQGNFSAASSWKIFNLKVDYKVNSNTKSFFTAVFDGRYLFIIGKEKIVRYDTTQAFTSTSSWVSFSIPTEYIISGTNSDVSSFSPDPYNIYFESYVCTTSCNKILVRYQKNVSSDKTWSSIDLPLPNSSKLLPAFDGGYAYFMIGKVIKRYNTQRTCGGSTCWTTFDAGSLLPSASPSPAGAVFDNRYVYFIPGFTYTDYPGKFLRYDTTKDFSAAASWTTSTAHAGGISENNSRFESGILNGGSIYFPPNAAGSTEILRYELGYPTPSQLPTNLCGNDVCEAAHESCSTCPKDCGVCASQCGDGMCSANETCSSCANDCGVCVTASSSSSSQPSASCSGIPSSCIVGVAECCPNNNWRCRDVVTGASMCPSTSSSSSSSSAPTISCAPCNNFTCSNTDYECFASDAGGSQCAPTGNEADGWRECGAASSSASAAVCGNGSIDVGEECDDNNILSGDGCSDICKIETPYTCAGSPSSCSLCGDGKVGGTEGCDDKNYIANDGCSPTCALEICGDKIVQTPREVCDNGKVCQQNANPTLRTIGITGQSCNSNTECHSVCLTIPGLPFKRCDADASSTGINCTTDADCISIPYSCAYDTVKDATCTNECKRASSSSSSSTTTSSTTSSQASSVTSVASSQASSTTSSTTSSQASSVTSIASSQASSISCAPCDNNSCTSGLKCYAKDDGKSTTCAGAGIVNTSWRECGGSTGTSSQGTSVASSATSSTSTVISCTPCDNFSCTNGKKCYASSDAESKTCAAAGLSVNGWKECGGSSTTSSQGTSTATSTASSSATISCTPCNNNSCNSDQKCYAKSDGQTTSCAATGITANGWRECGSGSAGTSSQGGTSTASSAASHPSASCPQAAPEPSSTLTYKPTGTSFVLKAHSHNIFSCPSGSASVAIIGSSILEQCNRFWIYEYSGDELARQNANTSPVFNGKFFISGGELSLQQGRANAADASDGLKAFNTWLINNNTLQTFAGGKQYYVMSEIDLQFSCSTGLRPTSS